MKVWIEETKNLEDKSNIFSDDEIENIIYLGYFKVLKEA